MKNKKELFLSRVNKFGQWVGGMDSQCWEFIPRNSNYSGKQRLSFNLGNGKTMAISLCGFLFFTGKLPDTNIYSLCKNKLCVNPSHYIDDYAIAHFGEFEKGGIRYKPCPRCGNAFPKTKEYFYFMGDGTLTCCKSCALLKVQESRAVNWERVLLGEARRRMSKGVVVNLTVEDIKDIYKRQKGKCYWSGLEMKPSSVNKYPLQPSLDRIDNSKGYTKDNVVLCCLSFNLGRNSLSKEAFEEFILEIKRNGVSTNLWK